MTICSHPPSQMWACWAKQHPLSRSIANMPCTLRMSMRKQILPSSSPCRQREPSMPRSRLSTKPVPSKATSGLSSSSSEQDLDTRLTRSLPRSA